MVRFWIDSRAGRLDHVASHAPYGSTVAHFDAANRRNTDGTACAARSATPNIWNTNVASSMGMEAFSSSLNRMASLWGLARSKT